MQVELSTLFGCGTEESLGTRSRYPPSYEQIPSIPVSSLSAKTSTMRDSFSTEQHSSSELASLLNVFSGGEKDKDSESGDWQLAEVFNEKKSTWWQSSFLLTGELMGTGILSLPYACGRLGWVLGLSSCVVFAVISAHTGYLLSVVKNRFYPHATSYYDLAYETGGSSFAWFTRISLMLTWAMLLPYYLISATSSLRAAFPTAGFCILHWGLIVVIVLLIPLQLRRLHFISYLALPSTIAVLIAVGLVILDLVITPADDTVVTSVGIPLGVSGFSVYSYMGAFIFSYQGHSIFMEIMREMKNSNQFPKAITTSIGGMMIAYILVSSLGYSTRGMHVAGFLPDSMGKSYSKTVVGMLLVFHILVAYVIVAQPLHLELHRLLWPNTADEESRAARLHWGIISTVSLVLGFLVSSSIPFFADVQGLIGSLGGAPIMFGWPAFFFLRAYSINRLSPSWYNSLLCVFYLFLLLPVCTVLGTLKALQDIVSDWHFHEPAFSCGGSPIPI